MPHPVRSITQQSFEILFAGGSISGLLFNRISFEIISFMKHQFWPAMSYSKSCKFSTLLIQLIWP